MKRRQTAPFIIIAATAIMGFSIASMYARHRRDARQQQELEAAQQTWEAEGGAVLPKVVEEPVT